jgi:hypothetical protein
MILIVGGTYKQAYELCVLFSLDKPNYPGSATRHTNDWHTFQGSLPSLVIVIQPCGRVLRKMARYQSLRGRAAFIQWKPPTLSKTTPESRSR